MIENQAHIQTAHESIEGGGIGLISSNLGTSETTDFVRKGATYHQLNLSKVGIFSKDEGEMRSKKPCTGAKI